jgi:hypothetical protein
MKKSGASPVNPRKPVKTLTGITVKNQKKRTKTGLRTKGQPLKNQG